MLIGLHMIVKNGGEMLNHCLNSVRDLVDEIIIVDTGSEDQSISIAESFGAKILQATWENNFSKARNLSIAHAKTDWIVYLDADEIFQGNARELRERLRNSDREGYWIDVESLNGSLPYEKVVHQSLRLFRSKPNLYFKGAIHEDIVPSLLNHGSQLHSFDKLDAKIIHLGYLPEFNQGNIKLQRNIHILEEALKQDTENHYYQYHLGVAYTQKGIRHEGIDLMEQALKNSDLDLSYRPAIVKDLAQAWITAEDYSAAQELLEKEKKHYPDYPDLYYLSGVCHLHKKEDEQALQMFQLAVQQTPERSYVLENGAGTFRSWTLMGDIAVKWHAYSDAVQFYMKALQGCPYYFDALYGFTDVLVASNVSSANIKKELDHLLEPSLSKANTDQQSRQLCEQQLAKVLHVCGCDEETIEAVANIDIPTDEVLHLRIQSYLFQGKWEEANQLLLPLLEKNTAIATELMQKYLLLGWDQARKVSDRVAQWTNQQPQAVISR